MKFFNKITIISILEAIVLAFFMVVPVIIMDLSWWWFFLPLIFIIISDMIIGLIVIIIKFVKRKKPEVSKLDIRDAKRKAIYEMKMEDDNPDNFKIINEKTIHIGERGGEKTTILLLEGYGTELRQKRVVIINMNNPKQKQTHLIDPEIEEVKECVRLIADNPPEEIVEETTTTIGQFGMPTTKTTIRKPSSIETIKKEEEEAEKGNAM